MPTHEGQDGLNDVKLSKATDHDFFMNRARLTADPKLSFGAIERRGNYAIAVSGGMWQETKGPITTCTRESVLGERSRYEQMLAARDADELTVFE
ncbi:MAG: hypothetical protein EZS28_020052 [Streblomastix strix]|uniref:Uncharacterized protein n=1 Tax=Streblomastix strix TaxID=222440 RepID=A0A5J4VPA6_9EUKA|nr:MAG: hypothetical protein EZS28_020052 [Streblomastix strix]